MRTKWTEGWNPAWKATRSLLCFSIVSGVSRTKIGEFTLDALRTRQSLVKGERLVRHEMRAVLRQVVPSGSELRQANVDAGADTFQGVRSSSSVQNWVGDGPPCRVG